MQSYGPAVSNFNGGVMDGLINYGCDVCGGKLVKIRGRYPKEEKREVCPTCLAERMDNIREMADKNYGKAYMAAPMPKLEL